MRSFGGHGIGAAPPSSPELWHHLDINKSNCTPNPISLSLGILRNSRCANPRTTCRQQRLLLFPCPYPVPGGTAWTALIHSSCWTRNLQESPGISQNLLESYGISWKKELFFVVCFLHQGGRAGCVQSSLGGKKLLPLGRQQIQDSLLPLLPPNHGQHIPGCNSRGFSPPFCLPAVALQRLLPAPLAGFLGREQIAVVAAVMDWIFPDFARSQVQAEQG